MAEAPSIARRLLLVTGLGSLLMALAVALATVLAVDEEVDELLDDALRASAEQLAPLLSARAGWPDPAAGSASTPSTLGQSPARFAWVIYDSAGRVAHASSAAAPEWLQQAPQKGFGHSPHWRLYDLPLGPQGEQGVLRVAQTRAERREARQEVSSFALMAALGVALLALPMLAWRAQQELRPLQRLARQLAAFDARQADPRELAQPLRGNSRRELEPLQTALANIGQRLAERLDFEREFSAQAAHLLRTPLAAMDAQLAVAIKELPGQPRLERVRQASQRLQSLVLALLRLFRTEPQLQRTAIDARALLTGLPLGGLRLEDGPPCPLQGDAELLTAALLNLIDNAQRHGAKSLRLSQAAGQTLCLHDDGTGLPDPQRQALVQRLAAGHGAEDGGGESGLGLRLALRVAQAHGGTLTLPDTPSGFAVELHL